ncbi:unnamed protein product [Chrysoparadoxa australica]
MLGLLNCPTCSTPREITLGCQMLNQVIEEGRSWPFEEQMTEDEFKSYFMSHHAYVLTEKRPVEEGEDEVLGVFYIKPNFPGRCSHVCNGGFITHPQHRRRGVGFVMGWAFLLLARDVGFRASYFNLVFTSNESSVRLWRRLGFCELALVPNVARLKGIEGYTDAIQFFRDLTCLDERVTVDALRTGGYHDFTTEA